MSSDCDAADAARFLSDREHATAAAVVSRESLLNLPGLYTWWVDSAGGRLLETVFGEPIGSLIYCGQAGATHPRSKTASSATLRTRIWGQHLGGNVGSSTFRLSISSILFLPLELRLGGGGRLCPSDRDRVTDWMRQHLAVAVWPCSDRERLGQVESAVLKLLDPPLNLKGMGPSEVRAHLSRLRRRLTHPSPGARDRGEC